MSERYVHHDDTLDTEPVPNPRAVLRDDVLVDTLAKGVLPMEYYDDELTRSLLVLRDDIRSTPFEPAAAISPVTARPNPADGHDAARNSTEHVSQPSSRSSTRISRRVILLVGACAAVALGSLGSVAAANVAEPGSPLWPLTRVVNADRANSLEARQDAFDNLDGARRSLISDPQVALEHLENAEAKANGVREQDGRSDLQRELQQIRGKLDGKPTPGPGDPSHNPSPSPSESPSPSDSPSPSPNPSSTPPPTESATPTGSPTS